MHAFHEFGIFSSCRRTWEYKYVQARRSQDNVELLFWVKRLHLPASKLLKMKSQGETRHIIEDDISRLGQFGGQESKTF
jgi:hypothetical protein